MLVRCDKCQTEFGLDDRQVPPDGVTARCSVCGHVFHVRPATGSGGDRPWQIRTSDGLLFAAPDMTTLKTWIAEGRLTPDDEVSRSGQVWLRLGDMPELTPLFGLAGGIIEAVEPPSDDAGAGEGGDAAARLPPPPDFAAALRDDDEDAEDAPRWRRSDEGALASGGGVPRSGPAPAAERVGAAQPGVVQPIPHEPSGSLLGVVSAHVTSGPMKAAEQRLAVYDASIGAPRFLDDEPASGIVGEGVSPAEVGVGTAGAAASGAVAGGSTAKARASAQTHAAGPEDGAVTSRAAATKTAPAAAPAITAEPARAVPIGDFDDDMPSPRRRGRGIWITALAGLLIGVGVVFGHPAIRAKVLSLGATPTDAAAGDSGQAPAPQTAAVDDAIALGGLAALAKAEAEVQRALDRGEGSDAERAELAVLLADVLATRSLLYSMAAVVDAAHASTLRDSARDDLTRAAQLVADVKTVPTHLVDRVGVVRARVRLAQGRASTDILPLLPATTTDAATKTAVADLQAVTAVHASWAVEDAAPVPSADVEAILARAGETSPSGVVVGAAIVASLRSGDTARAEELRKALAERVADHPLATVAIAGEGAPTEGAASGGEAVASAAGGKVKPTNVGSPATDGEAAGTAATKPSGGTKPSGSGGGGGSVDALLNRGCSQVESGSASAGVSTLLKAFDLDPTNVDVNVCLGIGYGKLKNHGRALHFFEKALDKSPKHREALEGAAEAAAKSGSTGKAKRLYERLLGVDPGNADAKAFLAANEGGGDAGSDGASDQGSSSKPDPEPAKPDAPAGDPP